MSATNDIFTRPSQPAPEPPRRIKPSIGRIMWFWNSKAVSQNPEAQPFAAQVAYVHGEGEKVNVSVLDPFGVPFPQTSVPVIQEGEEPPEKGPFVVWMPYQLGQAKPAA